MAGSIHAVGVIEFLVQAYLTCLNCVSIGLNDRLPPRRKTISQHFTKYEPLFAETPFNRYTVARGIQRSQETGRRAS